MSHPHKDVIDQRIDPVPVNVKGMASMRIRAPEFGNGNVYVLGGTSADVNPPTQLLRIDPYRRYAFFKLSSPNQGVETLGSVITGAVGNGSGGTAVSTLVNMRVTGFDVSLTAATAAYTVTLSNVAGGPIVYNVPSGQTQFSVRYPGNGLLASGGFATVTVQAVAGVGPGSVTLLQLTGGLTGNNNAGFVLIGTRAQVQNNQGMKMRVGDVYYVEDTQDWYMAGDGVTALEMNVYQGRYSPYELEPIEDENDDTY